MYNCERISLFVIFEDTPFNGRPVDGWNVAAMMPGRNVQVHYVHSDILTQLERPLYHFVPVTM